MPDDVAYLCGAMIEAHLLPCGMLTLVGIDAPLGVVGLEPEA